MQLRLLTAMMIYLGSYLPLSVILLFQDLKLEMFERPFCNPLAHIHGVCLLPLTHPVRALAAVIACAAALVLALLVLRFARPKQVIKVQESKHVPADLMNYVLPYVVAFMGLDYSDRGKLFGFIVFFIWIFVITYRSGQVILNPVLTVFGWRMYEVKYVFEGGSRESTTGTALARCTLHAGKTYRQAEIQDVLVVKGAVDES